MKKYFFNNIYKLILTLLISCSYTSIGNTKPVSIDNVQKVGQTKVKYEETKSGKQSSSWTKSNAIYTERSIKEVREIIDKTSKKVLAYVLDLEPKGYVVISPDTDITPVIAHSLKSNFIMEDSPNNILLHMVTWDMQNRLKVIPLISTNIKDKNNILWDKYLDGKDFMPTGTGVLTIYWPLISTHWDQGTPYNDYCPMDPLAPSENCLVGCVATSMAQIVNYFQYPGAVTFTADDNYTSQIDPCYPESTCERIIPITATTANFSNMTYPVTTNTGKAKLSYACGVASKVNYSSTSSGTSQFYAAEAFKKFGYYSADLKESSSPDFYLTLQTNIKNGQPAQLGIIGTGGHFIVCDGYDSVVGDYHLNFGWGNGSNEDTWYMLPDDLPNVGYNVVSLAVLNIKPHGDGGTKLTGLKAYPNPVYFNSSSFITIAGIPTDAIEPKIYIYNVAGELIRILKKSPKIRPDILDGNTAYWDGKNESGEKVASGLYIYLVKTGNYGKGTGKFYIFW